MITINDDLSSHIVSEDGSLECFLAAHNPETLKPFTSKEEVEAFIPSIYGNPNYWQPYKTPEEWAQLEASRNVAFNVGRAKSELSETDWCENASVRDTSSSLYLTNVAEFDAYRLGLRAIVVNKIDQVEEWPVAPTAVWSNAVE